MKVNKRILTLSIISILKRDHSLHNLLDSLLYLKIIKQNDYLKLNSIIKKDLSLIRIFEYYKYDKHFIDLVNFYLHYYQSYKAIEKALEYHENIKKYQKNLSSSLAYPIFLIISSIIVIVFIINNVIPQILIISTNQTNDFINILNIVSKIPIALTSLLIISIVYFILIQFLYYKKVSILFKYKYFIGYQKIFKYQCSILFCLYLKEVIKNTNISSNSIILLNQQSNNKIVKYITNDIINKLNKGYHLFDIINELHYFTKEFKYHFMLGENSKHLSLILDDYYLQTLINIKDKTRLIVSIIVPVVICLIGIIIILMYYLIMYPALNMNI